MHQRVPVSFIEVHDSTYRHPNGKGFGKCITVKQHQDLKVEYEEKRDLFFITWKGVVTKMSGINVVQWRDPETDGDVVVIENTHHTEDKKKRPSAQVSTPMGHVFEGQGAGKSGRG